MHRGLFHQVVLSAAALSIEVIFDLRIDQLVVVLTFIAHPFYINYKDSESLLAIFLKFHIRASDLIWTIYT